jgi:hypothetical protein
MEGEKD